MKSTLVLILAICLCSEYTDAADCPTEANWHNYKDVLCILADKQTFVNYEDAKKECEDKNARLVMVNDDDMQNFLTGIVQAEHFWLGAKHEDGKGEFIWEDGNPVKYDNWASGFPKMGIASGHCVFLKAPNTKANNEGSWEHDTCLNKLALLCQKPLKLNEDEISQEIFQLRNALATVTTRLDSLTTDTAGIKQSLLPEGMTYIQYPNQLSPQEVWQGKFQWEDVTGLYAGLFFRALGGDSEQWGVTQLDCSPRITEMRYQHPTQQQYNTIQMVPGKQSPFGVAGYHSNSTGREFREGLSFYTQACEVRPKNQAIRIWQRKN